MLNLDMQRRDTHGRFSIQTSCSYVRARHVSIHPSIHPSLPACLPACLPAYLHTYIHTYKFQCQGHMFKVRATSVHARVEEDVQSMESPCLCEKLIGDAGGLTHPILGRNLFAQNSSRDFLQMSHWTKIITFQPILYNQHTFMALFLVTYSLHFEAGHTINDVTLDMIEEAQNKAG